MPLTEEAPASLVDALTADPFSAACTASLTFTLTGPAGPTNSACACEVQSCSPRVRRSCLWGTPLGADDLILHRRARESHKTNVESDVVNLVSRESRQCKLGSSQPYPFLTSCVLSFSFRADRAPEPTRCKSCWAARRKGPCSAGDAGGQRAARGGKRGAL